MTIINDNRVKVNASVISATSDIILGSPVTGFKAFIDNTTMYTAISTIGEWEIGQGTVTGSTLVRNSIEQNHLGTTNKVDFTGQILQVAQTLTAEFINTLYTSLHTHTNKSVLDLVEDAFLNADRTKLDNIVSNATADQDLSGKENVGIAQGIMDTHETTHPVPTIRDSRNEIAKGADDNFVTDAEKVIISNTSGTNTGDQDLSGKENAGVAAGLLSTHETTNLTNTPSPTIITVESSDGSNTDLPLADATNAGLLKPADFIQLNTLPADYVAIFSQSSEPVSFKTGDIWVDTDA